MNSSTSSLSESIEISGEVDGLLLLAFDVDDLEYTRALLDGVDSTSFGLVADEPSRVGVYSSVSEHSSSSESDDHESEGDGSRLLRVNKDDGEGKDEGEGEEQELREEAPEEDNKLGKSLDGIRECGDGQEDKDSASDSLSLSSALFVKSEIQSYSDDGGGMLVDVQPWAL